MKRTAHQFRFFKFMLHMTCLMAMGLSAGCSTPSYLCAAPPGPRHVTLSAQPDANANQAIAVTLVYVMDEDLLPKITTLSAAEFFSRQNQLARDYGKALVMRNWEIAAGQIATDIDAHPVCNRVQTLLFARYSSPGDHRQQIAPASDIHVALGADDFTVTP